MLVVASEELKTNKWEFKRIKIMKITPYIIITIRVIWLYLDTYKKYFFYSIRVIIDVLYFSSEFIFVLSSLIFGFSNRRHRGYYVISFAILYFFLAIISYEINTYLTSYFPFQYIWVLAVLTIFLMIISTSYLIYFGRKIKNLYFVLSGLFFLGAVITNFFILYILVNILINFNFIIMLLFLSLIGLLISSKYLEIGRTFKKGIRIFITHAVEDYQPYRIREIARFLEAQKGIRYVYYCESDLTGNIDAWMQKTVPRCQLLVFFSTDKSLKSDDCTTELDIARNNQIQIIPILGIGLNWEDLNIVNLQRELGAEYHPMQFEIFCENLYQQILKYTPGSTQILNDEELKES